MLPIFEIKDVDLYGRIGILHTKHGKIETPAFFPVIDVARQEVSIYEIAEAGFRQVITNAYLLYKRYGKQVSDIGVHRFLGFEGVVMTDSGAYQILEYGDIEVDQETIIEYEKSIGSDIAVILDIPTGDVGREEAVASVEETMHRARLAEDIIDPENRFWLLPIQGGRYLDLVRRSAREALRLARYNMYGVGSPTVFLERYRYDVVLRGVATARSILPGGRPLHLFGAGHPLIIPFAVALGVDTFDSASYIIYARDGRYMTDYGVYRLEEISYFPCNCPVCSRYTPQELREMPREERTRLLAIHNLYVIRRSIERVKQAIREGRLWEHLEEVAAKHHSGGAMMRVMIESLDLIERGAPTSKGVVKGARATSAYSLFNPKLVRFREKALEVIANPPPGIPVIAVLRPLIGKPDPSECTPRGKAWVIYYAPYLGLIPQELCGVYPSIQFDYHEPVPREVVFSLAQNLGYVYSLLKSRGFRVTVEACSSAEWSVEAARLSVGVYEEKCG